jgi:putative membrane protein
MKMSLLSQAQLDALARAIGEAEKRTSGEIRLMIVKRSTPVGHVPQVLWLMLVALSLLVLWFERDHFVLGAPLWLIPALLFGAAVIAYVLSYSATIGRLFVSMPDRRQAALARAELEFHREGLSHTQGATGILLFLSRFERQAVVLADRGIASRLDPSVWKDVVALITSGAAGSADHLEAKLKEAISLCGRLLAEHFPIQPGDVNELPNTVIVKD